MTWGTAIVAAYAALLVPLAALGLHRLWLVFEYLRRPAPVAPPAPDVWPAVTVQLPLFNEKYVAERLIRAARALDYPNLEIQVLDDSVDDTRDVVDAIAAKLGGVEVIRRTHRDGFKAGALAHGLSVARGDLVAVFDADFVPEPDFLRRMVPWLVANKRVGLAQARWGHLNAGESWLTAAQATLLDGHFVVEHAARHRGGRWFNFNGTAGVWRRDAIVDAGGWSADTLTEDLDLSYRAQLAGWKFVYVDDVVAPAELPSSLAAFKGQQHRWAKGSVQTARKLLPTIWRSRAPLADRVEATFHLLGNSGWPLGLAATLLLPLVLGVAPALPALVRSPIEVLPLGFGIGATVLYYVVAGMRTVGLGAWWRLPTALAVGAGLAVSQTGAVFSGWTSNRGTFVRTPKRGAGDGVAYLVRGTPAWVFEGLVAAWLLVGIGVSVSAGRYGAVPLIALLVAGYAAVGLRSAREWFAAAAVNRAAPG